MKNTFLIFLFELGVVFLANVAGPFVVGSLADEGQTVDWRPATFDEFDFDRRFVDALLERGLDELANVELSKLDSRLENASDADRFRFAATSIRVVLATSKLASNSDRAKVAEKIAVLRRRVEKARNTPQTFDDKEVAKTIPSFDYFQRLETTRFDVPVLEYASALVRAYFELGVLERESGKLDERNAKTDSNVSNESHYLTAAFELSKTVAQRVASPSAARSFLYLSAKTLIEQGVATNADAEAARVRQIEQIADALEKTPDKNRDEYYFFAKLLRIQSARVQGNGETASNLIEQTLRELEKANAESPNAPRELAVALVAEETRLLALEGKTAEALRLARSDVDLLNRPLPKNSRRFDAVFFDVFADRDLARAELFWRAAASDDKIALPPDDPKNEPQTIEKKELIDAAKLTVARLPSNFWQTRASFLVRAANNENDADWRTAEAAAETNFRDKNWEKAIADYDRASELAAATGADVDAFRLSCAAAGIVDKVNRDKIYASNNSTLGASHSSTDANFWRENARDRFDRLSRSNPSDPLAPRLFLISLDYATQLNIDAASQFEKRREYLTLFPNAENRDAFANGTARLAFEDGRLDDATSFLDFVPATSIEFPQTLELAEKIAQKRFADAADNVEKSDATFAATVRWFLSKTAAGNAAPTVRAGALSTPVESQITQTAQNLTSASLAVNDSQIFETLFEFALTTQKTQNAPLNSALETLLDRWKTASTSLSDVPNVPNASKEQTAQNTQNAQIVAKIRSFRLSLWLDAKKTDDILKLVAELGRSTPDAAFSTLERLLVFAEKASPETQKSLGEFALSVLDAQKDAQTVQIDSAPTLPDAAPLHDAVSTQILRADALRFAGKTQESLTLFAQIRKKNPKNVAATVGIAKILTSRSEKPALEQALKYWSDAADIFRVESPQWWDAQERCFEIYCRLNRRDQAEKMLKILWLTHSDPTDPDRRTRWEEALRK